MWPAGRSGVRLALLVGIAVAIVVELRVLFGAEARGVAPDRIGAVLISVLCVLDQVGLGELEAFRFAFAGLDQRRERRVDGIVGILGPFRHDREATRARETSGRAARFTLNKPRA
jgi:hypothetical protein